MPQENTTGTNPAITAYETSNIFLRDLKFDRVTVTVPATTTLSKGTVLGQNVTSKDYEGSDSTGTSGSQKPVVVLAEDLVNSTGSPVDKANVKVCVKGEVDEDNLTLVNGSDDFDSNVVIATGDASTDITLGTFREVLRSAGVILRKGQEQTFLDNGASLT